MLIMTREQKNFKKDILKYRETCKEYYHISKERKCEGCPYEYLSEPDHSGCTLILAFRKLNALTPSYWAGSVIESIFKENNNV